MNNTKYDLIVEHPNFISNYKKLAQFTKNKSAKLKLEYEKEPRKCLNCGIDIPYDKRNNRYCSISCGTTYTNKLRRPMSVVTRNKLSIACSKQNRKRVDILKRLYLENPNTCTVCNNILPYELRNRKTCSILCKLEICSSNAKLNKLGGNRNRKASWYISNIAGKVWLESSYEKIVAEELDKNEINWNRPKGLKWIDTKDKSHLYYPDFYLIEYDIYLDPKNSYLTIKDSEKIKLVQEQNNVKVLVLDKNNLMWDSIKLKIFGG